MFRRFRFLIGVDPKAATAAKALPAVEARRNRPLPLMSEALQEIAVYIHRFHNLDLFQQGFLIGVDPKAATAAKALPAVEARRNRPLPLMSEALQEIAVYIHRFHNLDLFQQGWYQIKVSMRWEDTDDAAPGIPARVVQYEEHFLSQQGFVKITMTKRTTSSMRPLPLADPGRGLCTGT
eukprot:Gb_23701 [translate_table: standard]